MKKALIVLVSISVLAFFLPSNHATNQKSTQVAESKVNADPIYPPFG